MATLRSSIALKIFGIAIGLLVLMGIVALLSLRMTRTVDNQLVIVDHNYFPAYVSLANANIRSVEESAFIRRLIIAFLESPRDDAKVVDLQQRAAVVEGRKNFPKTLVYRRGASDTRGQVAYPLRTPELS